MTTVLSVGIGAYDHVYRAAMMSKLLEVPVCAISCHSCDRRMVPPHLIRGKMQMGKGTESTKKKGVNKVTH